MLRRFSALAFLLLAALAVAHYVADNRRDIDRFLDTYAFDLRRPDIAHDARLELSDDFAAYAVADAAIRDAIEPVSLNDLTPEVREAWLDMVPNLQGELAAAQTLMLRAAADRPGWPYHRAMLGRLAYVAHRREGREALAERSPQWIEPLRSAMADAPSDSSLPQLLAARLLETAPALPPETLEQQAPVVQRALGDAEFVERALVATTAVYGTGRALAMLPDDPAPLGAAFRVAVQAEAVTDAATIFGRWERAEWNARQAGLAEIERRLRRNDVEALRRLVPAWAARHQPDAFDTPAARRQLARILEIWPRDVGGVWPDDRRAPIIGFFMRGRAEPAYAHAIAGAAEALGNVPEPMQARLALLSGDSFAAEEIARGSMTAGGFEWTRFYVELARHWLVADDVTRARGALGAIAPAAQSECDVLLARRDIARAAKDVDELAEVDPLIDAAGISGAPRDWSEFGALSLCVDPWSDANRSVAVTVTATSPSLLAWGWNGADRGTFLAGPNPVRLRAPLAGLTGRNALRLRTLAGPRPSIVATSLE